VNSSPIVRRNLLNEGGEFQRRGRRRIPKAYIGEVRAFREIYSSTM